MTCVRCQTIEAALASGNELSLIDELYRQLDYALAEVLETRLQVADGPRVRVRELEAAVCRLNETIARLNKQIAKGKP